MVLAVYLPAIQSRVSGENKKKALVFKDSNMRWQLKTQGSSHVSPPVSLLGHRPKPLGRENQGELLAAQGCKHNVYTGHAVGLCQGAWSGSGGRGRPSPGPAQAQQLVLKLSFIC